MAAVMTMMGRGSDWATAKKALGEGNFLTQVIYSKVGGGGMGMSFPLNTLCCSMARTRPGAASLLALSGQ